MTISLTDFPDYEDPRPPKLFDEKDSVDTFDLKQLDAQIDAVQTYVGESPGDRSVDCGGKNFGSLAANFRALCRMRTGQELGSVPFIGLVQDENDVWHLHFGNSFWYYKTFFYNASRSDGTFSEAPVVVTQCEYYSSADSGSYSTFGSWRVRRNYVKFKPGGVLSNQWVLSYTSGKGYRFNWFAVQPPHGQNLASTETATGV
tara:strand:- start:4634 stop:5239 length:606 start_codon:yes stop_codon:yes gene_type:complete